MPPETALFAFDLCQGHPLPEQRVLVYNPRNDRKAVLTADVFAALQECRVFRTLAEHAEHLSQQIPALQGQQQAVVKVLERVRQDGLMLSAEVYQVTLQAAASPPVPRDRPVVAIITWERPEALARCLQSLGNHCDLRQVARVYVIDDSRSADAMQTNRDTTEHFAVHAAAPVVYLGADVQHQFTEDLAGLLPEQAESVRFLLDRQRWSGMWSSGRARTLALLLSVGERLLVLDDDIVCEVHETGSAGPPSFADHIRAARFYRDNDGWADLRATQQTDPLHRHGQVLGGTLGNALAQTTGATLDSFAGAQVAFLEALTSAAPVLVTECGSLGDPGTVSSNWLTGLQGDSRARLLASDESVATALQVRNAWCGREALHFTPHANMSQLTGLDNRQCLPPYLPIMRGEDRLFGEMTGFVFPQSVVVDLPWSLPHLPIPARNWGAEQAQFDIGQGFPNFLPGLFAGQQGRCHAHSPEARLAFLGQMIHNLGMADHQTLQRHYHQRLLDEQAFRYRHLKQSRVADQAAPQAWLDYLDDGIARLNQALVADRENLPLAGFPENLRGERLSQFWADTWQGFAAALLAWPAIREAARRAHP